MRIIAGDYKGRRLNAPADYKIRPTADKVKGALFSIIGDDIDEAVVCDLFSGTGNLGLEALSRGADKCYFVDNSAESIRLIKENIEMCRAEEYSVVIHGDFKKALSQIAHTDEKVNVFFLDPPYYKDLWESAMELIRENDLLAGGGMIVCEHRKEQELPEQLAGYEKVKERKYGKVVLSIYET